MIHLDRTHDEGPFVDLTGTYDIIRKQPILEVTAITHRRDAIWQALLPGALEHKLLMGMPREPTIFNKVNEVVDCQDVNITPGGASWLHAVVQINKHSESDGKAAIQAAFAGHRSCKHVFIVDSDIDIYDPQQVEWALATRFQGDRDMVIKAPEQGSSLDPSAHPDTNFTTKIGFDLTAPLGACSKTYTRADFPQVDLERLLTGEIDK
jgi:2,5-furandicarboxylate decarboxylase 1